MIVLAIILGSKALLLGWVFWDITHMRGSKKWFTPDPIDEGEWEGMGSEPTLP